MRNILFAAVLFCVAAHCLCSKKDAKKTEKRGIMDGVATGVEASNNIQSAPQNSLPTDTEINRNQNSPVGNYGNNFRNGVSVDNTEAVPNSPGINNQNDFPRAAINAPSQRFPVPVAHHYQIPFQRLVHFNIPQPIPTPLLRQYPVQLPQAIQVTLQRPYPVPEHRAFPFQTADDFPVAQPHLVPVQVSQPYPLNIPQTLPTRAQHPPILLPITRPVHQNWVGTHAIGNSVENRSVTQTGNAASNTMETVAGKDAQQHTRIDTENPAQQPTPPAAAGENGNVGNSELKPVQNPVASQNHLEVSNGINSESQEKLIQPSIGTLIDIQKGPLPSATPHSHFGKDFQSGIGAFQLPSISGLFGSSLLSNGIKSGFGGDIGTPFANPYFSLGNNAFGSTLNSFGSGHGYPIGLSGLRNNHGFPLGSSSAPSLLGFGNTAGSLSNSFSSGGFSFKN